MPGLGNPLTDIDVGDFNKYLGEAAIIAKAASGTMTDRDLVELESG